MHLWRRAPNAEAIMICSVCPGGEPMRFRRRNIYMEREAVFIISEVRYLLLLGMRRGMRKRRIGGWSRIDRKVLIFSTEYNTL